jgi:hypothetical protein
MRGGWHKTNLHIRSVYKSFTPVLGKETTEFFECYLELLVKMKGKRRYFKTLAPIRYVLETQVSPQS